MEFNYIIGYLLAILVGVSLGLIGSGGSILTVPILVYVLAVEPVLATAYSLFIVGTSALVGGVNNAFQKNVYFTIVGAFGIPSLLSAYFVRAFVIPAIPDVLYTSASFTISKSLALMLLFAVVMLLASVRMIRSKAASTDAATSISYVRLALLGVFTGMLSGAVGAGGGFLIIPALVFLAHIPIKKAVGTSLFIVALQSLAGFMGDIFQRDIDWVFLLTFTATAISGIFIGTYLSKKIPGAKLKVAFGWFILTMAFYILIKELFLN
ncbi:sulfite exporter TauE/SafE family protein [Flavobacterium litorale]|uniref:Probable membrane transporter protein n=1 Tax=Flavobacterium litorale TaxID=2856519 RepID=A0ABX8V4H6_9FLAO|nr:sulfite exporter TauE/SafE family protein [Flavobacterium litorale]QYJ67744.1 sulfite exporter TauE/SafE family protein [Flavobacterium litorale]